MMSTRVSQPSFKSLEGDMSSDWNEFKYAKEFNGNLHGQIEPVPARVNTTVRTMSRETAREVRMYRTFHCAPRYAIETRDDLPMHPSLEAMGRHYFAW
jgi:hypothetical protein